MTPSSSRGYNGVPLRDFLDERHAEVIKRLDRIDSKLDGHQHGEKVSWAALVPLILTIIGIAVVL
jgi:hypothetical protein